jgi:TolB-like protein/Flp pilus assembly protein TadD
VNPTNFLTELKRRNVYRAAVAYGVVAWFLTQLTTQVLPLFEIPNSAMRFVVIALVVGFPIAMLLAWVYELTPEGVVRTEDLHPAQARSIQRATGRILDFVIIGVLLLVIAMLIVGRLPFYRHTGELFSQKSIAILPFENRSEEKANAYFADGIQDEILTRLSKIADLKVISRTSTQQYQSKPRNLREIGKQLGVAIILEGSVQKAGDQVRVNVQLVNAQTDSHLWADTFDRKLTDTFSVESDVAERIAASLQARLTGREQEALKSKPTNDPEAYDLYLRGRYLLNKRTAESIYKALELFKEALTRDPRFALGHTGLADSYILLGEYGVLEVGKAANNAWPEVSAALQINDQLAEGYLSRAILLADFQWKWAAAEADYRKAIELDPNSATARHWFALHLAQQGRTEEALQEIKIAQQRDPLAPIIRAARAKILLNGRRFAEAVEQSHKALDLEPNFAPAYSVLAQAFAFQQQYPEALEAAKKYVELTGGGDQELLELAYVQALSGQKVEAENIVHAVQSRGQSFSPYDMAAICVALQDHPCALEWLEKAIEQHSIDTEWIEVDPRMEGIRSDRHFRELLTLVSGAEGRRKSL